MTKFIFLILFSSCSAFVNQLDKDLLSQKKEVFFGNAKEVTCKKRSRLEIINSNKYSQETFLTAIESKLKNYRFNFIEKIVLWSLYQFNLRPDTHSPSSKYQIIVRDQGAENYYHFYSKEVNSYPLLYGLDYLLNKYPSRYSLITLARIVDDNFNNNYTVSKNFEDFLSENSSELFENIAFKNRFFRGDESLKENENIIAQDLVKMIKLYTKTKSKIKYNVSQKLFSYKNDNLNSYCNYDMSMYNNSIYLIHKDFINSHLYGLKDKDNFFLASSSQDFKKIESIAGTHFIQGKSFSRSAAFCKFEFNKGQTIWLSSTKSRDPGQHLYHLIEYGIDGVSNIKELEQIMRFSRHLFLENPHRLIIESKRSSEEQLSRILRIDIPIYNAQSLGKIWGHFQSKTETGFIIDDREAGHLLCR